MANFDKLKVGDTLYSITSSDKGMMEKTITILHHVVCSINYWHRTAVLATENKRRVYSAEEIGILKKKLPKSFVRYL